MDDYETHLFPVDNLGHKFVSVCRSTVVGLIPYVQKLQRSKYCTEKELNSVTRKGGYVLLNVSFIVIDRSIIGYIRSMLLGLVFLV